MECTITESSGPKATSGLPKQLERYCPQWALPYAERVAGSPIAVRLIRGTLWSILGTAISRGMMLLASILVARFLGKFGYGEFGMIRSTVGMLGILAGFGMGLTATKFLAELKESDPVRAGRIVGLTWNCALISSGLICLIMVIFAGPIAEHTLNNKSLAAALRVGTLLLLIGALNGVQTGALAGFEAFKGIAKVNFIVGIASFPILTAGAYLGGVMGALIGLAINLALHWFLNHLLLKKEFAKHNITPVYSGWREERNVLWKYSVPAVVSGMMVAPILWLGKSVLANQPEGYGELGVFTLAETWRTLIIVGCGMIGRASFPVMAQLYGEGKHSAFKKALFAQLIINATIVCSFTMVVILSAHWIEKAYGDDFKNSATVIIIVLLSAIPMQLTAVCGFVNRCVGNIWWGVLLNSIWGTSYIMSVFLLVHKGAIGLAWATLIAYAIHLLTTSIYVVWVFRTSPKLKALPDQKHRPNCQQA